tara:strand:+ start:2430 stop:2894 length:465 start_codon:yes stop_codon:yes gene_type:complete
MMDLVLVGLFALWLGRNMEFDFSQNRPITPELPPETIPAKFTEWSLVREQNDRFGIPCSLWKRQYKQGEEVLFEQFQIRRDGQVLRSGYRNEEEAFAEFEKTVRPFRDGELEDLEEKARQKEEEMNPPQEQPKEREPTPLYSDMNKGGSRNGSF